MKNSYCLLIVCLGLPSVVFSQDYKVTWSPYNEDSQKYPYAYGRVQLQILDREKDCFYGVVGSTLHKISYEGEILESVKYAPNLRFGSNANTHHLQTKVGMFRVESIRNKQKKEWTVHSTKLNENLDGQHKIQMQFQLPKSQTFTPLSKLNQEYGWGNLDFNFAISPDSSKVAFGNLLESKSKKKSANQYAVFVFDENMELVNQVVHNLPENAIETLTPHPIAVTNDGTVYLPAVYREHEWKTEPIFKVFILKENEVKEVAVNLSDNAIPSNAAVFSVENDNAFILTGIYEGEEEIKGTYYAHLSLNDKPADIKMQPFEPSFTEDMRPDMLKPKKGENHYMREYRTFPNGDLQFITEYYKEVYLGTPNMPPGHRYGNIIVTTLNQSIRRTNQCDAPEKVIRPIYFLQERFFHVFKRRQNTYLV